MNTQKIINRIDGQWVACNYAEYNPQDTANFMFSLSSLTNIVTYYKRIS